MVGACAGGGGWWRRRFPMADALRNPDFGFVRSPRKVIEIADFSRARSRKTEGSDARYGGGLPPRTWDPLHLLDHPAVRGFFARYYGYVPEMRADEIAGALSMHVVRRWTRRGLSMELLERSGHANVTTVLP